MARHMPRGMSVEKKKSPTVWLPEDVSANEGWRGMSVKLGAERSHRSKSHFWGRLAGQMK
jgi:hypothetical protein